MSSLVFVIWSKEGTLNTVLKLTVNSKLQLLSESESGNGYYDLVLIDDCALHAVIIELQNLLKATW